MNITDKKKEIIEVLQSTNNDELIEHVYELLHPDDTIDQINVDNLPPDLQSKINRALADYKSGNYITHAQMKEKVSKWLTN